MPQRLPPSHHGPRNQELGAMSRPVPIAARRASAQPPSVVALGWLVLLSIAALLWLSPLRAAPADHRWPMGDYVVNANAVRTDFLAPAVAQKLGIERRDDRAVLTVSVQQDDGAGPVAKTVSADVNAVADSQGRRQTLGMQQRRVNGVTYYVGTMPIRNRQRVDFAVSVGPHGSDQTGTISFERVFETD